MTWGFVCDGSLLMLTDLQLFIAFISVFIIISLHIRDSSLITGKTGLQNGSGGGGQVKLHPYKKGGAEKVLR